MAERQTKLLIVRSIVAAWFISKVETKTDQFRKFSVGFNYQSIDR